VRQGGDDTGPRVPQSAERAPLAPISQEGRISSFDLDGSRIRIVTEAERGRDLVVRTTLARDGSELRRFETSVDPPIDGDLERSLRELIDLQHARTLREVSRLAEPAAVAGEVTPVALQPGELAPVEEVRIVPPVLTRVNGELAPPVTVPAEPLEPRRARRKSRANGTGRPPARRRTPPPVPPPVVEEEPAQTPLEAVTLERSASAPAEQAEDVFAVAPERYDAFPTLEPNDRPRRSRAWLAVVPALLLFAAGLLLMRPFGAGTNVSAPPAPPIASAPAPASEPPAELEAEPSAPITPAPQAEASAPSAPAATAEPSERPSARPRPARATQAARSPEARERLVRGRREWAQALYDAGRYEEARAALDEVFRLAPGDAEARRLLATILRTPRVPDSPAAAASAPRELKPATAGQGATPASPGTAGPTRSDAAREPQTLELMPSPEPVPESAGPAAP
jgi:hypothetical protein